MSGKYSNINGCSFKLRFFAFLIDFFICLFISILFVIPEVIVGEIICNIFSLQIDSETFAKIGAPIDLAILILSFVLKDIVLPKGSIGKMIFKLRIVDFRTLNKPKLWKSVVANLFSFAFPLEYIVYRSSLNNQTLGDIVTSTVVVETSFLQSQKEKAVKNYNDN